TAGYEGQRSYWGRCGWQATMVDRPMPRQPPFRNNARLVLLATAGALLAFLAAQLLLRKSRDFAPDFLASVLLYGLTVLNLTLLLVLVFILGRNLVRVLMERRRKVLGARFRMRLLLVFLLMAIAPSVLLVVVGSDIIQQAVDRWFSVDVERILSSSQALGTALRESVAARSRIHARGAVPPGRPGEGGGAGEGRGGRGAGGGGGVDPPSRGRGGGGARGAGALHEVPQDGSGEGPDQGALRLGVPPGRAPHPVRGGVALALPRSPHHDAPAPRRRGGGAHSVGRARGAGRFPVQRRRVRRPHRVLQP